MLWSERVDRAGAQTYSIWLKKFSPLHDVEADETFLASLDTLLGWYTSEEALIELDCQHIS
jgi:hypothetical protein